MVELDKLDEDMRINSLFLLTFKINTIVKKILMHIIFFTCLGVFLDI